MVQVALFGRARVDRFDSRGIDLLAIANQKLAVGTDKWRVNRDARDRDAVDATIGALGSRAFVDVREQSGDIGATGCDGYSLDQTWQQDGIPRERYQRQAHILRLAHGGDFGAFGWIAGSVGGKPAKRGSCGYCNAASEDRRMRLCKKGAGMVDVTGR